MQINFYIYIGHYLLLYGKEDLVLVEVKKIIYVRYNKLEN